MGTKPLLGRVKDFLFGSQEPEPAESGKRRKGRPATRSPRPRADAAATSDIVAAMVAYKPPPRQGKPGKPTLTADWEGFPRKDARFIEQNPNALLFGVIMDRMMNANQAWLSVCLLKERLGHLDAQRIAKMSADELAARLGRWKGEKSLHRFPPTMAKNLIAASARLVKEYDGDAANIWSRDPGVEVVVERLLKFDGISDKLASMAARILVSSYGVVLSGWEDLDVAVDRHVARVFLRTGLVAGKPGKKTYRVAEIREDVVTTARRLSPKFPGALDDPGFWIGKTWCSTERAWCSDGTEPCPLAHVCPQNRKAWNIEG